MYEHIRHAVQAALWVLWPALLFFITGALAVERQSRGMRTEHERSIEQERREVLRARHEAVQADLWRARSPAVLGGRARPLGLRPPRAEEIVLVEIRPSPDRVR